ncbi:MAG: two-component sensor histidine kinase [Desulfobacterales bacterium]|nr:two-component sensor histidine kinase [Desulfobacterales bacterium]
MVSSKKAYRELRRYIVIMLCVSAAIPLAFIGGGIYYEYQKSLSAKTEAQLTTIVLQHKGTIELFLQDIRSAMKLVTAMQPRQEISRQPVLEGVFQALQREYDHAFEDLGVIDTRGRHLAYVGPYDLLQRNYGEALWFKEVLEKQVFISDVFLGFRNVPHFIIAIKQGQGEDAWILRATISAAKFGSVVENVRLGNTGEAFIINKDGRFQTRPRMGGNVMEVMQEASSESLDLSTFDGVRLRRVEHKDREILRTKTWIKEYQWMLIVQQDVDDAFAELYTTRTRAIVVFVLGALMVAAVAVATTSLLVRKIEKADQEKKLLDEQLIQSQKLASIGELSAGVAHEINNPLAVIGEEAGWLQDLLKRNIKNAGLADQPEFEDSLREIVVQTGRCREITHKLLSFARKMDSVIKDVPINELIDEVVGMRQREAYLNNVTFEKEYDPDLPAVFSDPSLLRQVMLNIINNAVDALPKGGKVTIRTSPTEAGDSVLIAVSDTGIGIPRENITKIFDPFFTTKPQGKGTGLGLSICHGIIQKLGGAISVDSEVGKGTTFSIKLPLEIKKGAI